MQNIIENKYGLKSELKVFFKYFGIKKNTI